MICSISTDFLYFLFFWREAIRAPPFTFLVALNYLNLCRMVEYPSWSCCPISFRLNCGFFPYYFWLVYSANILFISTNFSLVIVVLIFLFFFDFFPWILENLLLTTLSVLETISVDSVSEGWSICSSISVWS
jgi:hypothetical protein